MCISHMTDITATVLVQSKAERPSECRERVLFSLKRKQAFLRLRFTGSIVRSVGERGDLARNWLMLKHLRQLTVVMTVD